MICFAIYVDGSIHRILTVPDRSSLAANLGDGEVAYEIPLAAATSLPIDLALVRALYLDRIDSSAGAARTRYITDVPGQPQTYAKKEAEARSWQEGDPDSDYPFMAAEAAVRGVPIAQVRGEILAQVNALTPIAALIEAHRLHAKQQVKAAETIPVIFDAASIDWAALLP